MDSSSFQRVELGCWRCSAPLERWYLYCPECVARIDWDRPLVANTSIPFTCPTCNSPVRRDFGFCTQCASPLDMSALVARWRVQQFVAVAWLGSDKPIDVDIEAA